MMDSSSSSSSSSSESKVSYTPLSFYMDSSPAVDYSGPVLKGNSKNNNSTPLSLYTTILVSQPAPPGSMGESKMDIFVSNKLKFLSLRKNHPLSFYMDPTYRGRLRITYTPLHGSQSKVSQSKVSFGSQSSTESSKSESKISFGSFGSQSSTESSKSESKISFGSFGSQSSTESKVSFGSFGSQSSESKIIFGSFGSQFSESKVSKNYIPEEVAFSILSKLSIKSLKRFGCVCKSWSILFENTDLMSMYSKNFISRHGSHEGYHTFILTNNRVDGLYHSEFHLLEDKLKLNLPSPLQLMKCHRGTRIVGSTSVNGIFCLGQPSYQRFQYVLWNPLTQEFMVVPPSPSELAPTYPRYGGHLQHVFHGFGYDQLRDDFKVIQFISFEYLGYCPTIFFQIYSLKSNSWRTIHMEKDLGYWDHGYYAPEVYLDGACHWLVLRWIDDKNAMSLLSFDLSDEVFLTTPIGVEPFSPYTPNQRLTVLNGSIALISNYHDDIVFHISILGELGVSESWIKLYIYGPLPSIRWPPIGFGKMGYMFIKKKDNEVVYVDLSTQMIEEVGIITGGKTREFIGGLYKESLLSIGVSSN